MSVSREWVSQVKAVLAEAAPRPPAKATGSSEAWQRFEAEQQIQAPSPLEQTPRARGIREINRIALRYGWGSEVERWLDLAGAAYVADLADHEVDDLAAHMRELVERAHAGCDLEDAPPAR